MGGGVRCIVLQKTVEAHRNGVPEGWCHCLLREGDIMRAGGPGETYQPHSPNSIPPGRVQYTVRRAYCVCLGLLLLVCHS